jgi:hypothetical protein
MSADFTLAHVAQFIDIIWGQLQHIQLDVGKEDEIIRILWASGQYTLAYQGKFLLRHTYTSKYVRALQQERKTRVVRAN